MTLEKLTGLEQGRFTQVDQTILDLSKKVREQSERRNIPIHQSISEYIKRKLKDQKDQDTINREFRNRTASEIVNSGYVNGCTDRGLVFITLARALGIPALDVETLKKDWLKNGGRTVEGHVFADVKVNGRWFAYEPVGGFCEDGEYKMGEDEYKVIGKGVDFSYIFEFKGGIYQPNPVDFTDICRVARAIRGEKND